MLFYCRAWGIVWTTVDKRSRQEYIMFRTAVPALCALLFVVCSARYLGKREDDYIRLMTGRYDPFHNECEFLEEDRQVCGKPTYDEDECHKRGCCYQQCPGCAAEIPWCFLAHRMLREECQVSYENKDDCGYYGIGEGECFMRGCCWAPSPLTNDPSCFHGVTIKLVDGDRTTDTLSGRVEINHDGTWGTVCDDNFDQNAADVVCRSLGYEYAEPKSYAEYGEGTGPILLDGMRCSGNEDRIEECSHNGWGSHDCSHSEDAGAVCSHEPIETYSYYGGYNYYNYYNYPYEYVEPYYYNYTYEYGDYGDNGDQVNATEGTTDVDELYPWYRIGGKGKGGKGKGGKGKFGGYAKFGGKGKGKGKGKFGGKGKYAGKGKFGKGRVDAIVDKAQVLKNRAVEKQLKQLNQKHSSVRSLTDEMKHAKAAKLAHDVKVRGAADTQNSKISKKTLAILKAKIHEKREAMKKRQTKKSIKSATNYAKHH